MIDQLYGEIREAQKFRFELLKWKIFLVSGLCAVGFGVTGSLDKPHMTLCLVPLACLYVDVLHRHLLIRGKVNGEYLKCTQPAEEFEKAFREVSTSMAGNLTFESLAILLSSILFSLGVTAFGILENRNVPLIVCGLLGAVLSAGIEIATQRKLSFIKKQMPKVVERIRAEASEVKQ